jgi:hypothetical protein
VGGFVGDRGMRGELIGEGGIEGRNGRVRKGEECDEENKEKKWKEVRGRDRRIGGELRGDG